MAKNRTISNDDQMTLDMWRVTDLYDRLADDLVDDLIERIIERGTADLEREPWLWQLEKLNDMHRINNDLIKKIAKQTGIAKELIEKVIANEGLKTYTDTHEQLAAVMGKNPPHNDVKQALAAYTAQVFRELDNYVNQTLLTTSLGDNAAMRAYKEMVEETTAKVITGTMTKQKAISTTAKKWVDKGLASSFRDKAGRRWRADTYARTVVQSTASRVRNEMRTQASEAFGVNTYYYSLKPTSREACAGIQGKVVTKGEAFYSDELGYMVESLQAHGYGTPAGALGINCGHTITPFVIGVNYPPEIPDHLKDITPEKAMKNAQQQAKQRALERAVRNDKRTAAAAEKAGDGEAVEKAKAAQKAHTKALNDLIKKHDFLHRDYSRTKIYD